MSGFRGGKSHVSRYGYVDYPLVKLVEEYLVKFKHMSFINLDHMGDVIRKQSFKYGRMKPNVFKEQLRRAYEQYSNTTTQVLNEFSGASIQMDNTPLTDDVLKEMEGYPSESDSDLEIDESPTNISKDAGIDQMKNLYLKPTAGKSTEGTINPESTNRGTGTVGDGANRVDKSDCISVGSSTDVSTDGIKAKATIPKEKKVTEENANEDIDSESDLEIIEEVSNEKARQSVITNGYGYPLQPAPSAQRVLKDAQAELPVQSNSNADHGGTKNVRETSKSNTETVNAPQTVKKVDPPTRGVKRKATGMPESSQGGLNEDMTRKKPKREVTIVKDTGCKLEDFAGSDKVVEEVCKLLLHLKHPEVYQTLGVTPPRGFLLHGPPGTGKTLLAHAIAGELQTPMLKIAGTELVSGISGESESNIRDLFNQAVAIAPCIIFIDEIDSVTPRRENVNKEMERRIVAQLLACIDDLVNKEKGDQVLLVGATNRIEAIDTALRRAGRFDREICLGIPDERSREKILSVICRNLKLEPGFDVKTLAKLTPGYVGADLQALVREAAVQAVNRKLMSESVDNSESTRVALEDSSMEATTVIQDDSTMDVTDENLVIDEGADNQNDEKSKENQDMTTQGQEGNDSNPENHIENNSKVDMQHQEDVEMVGMEETTLQGKGVEENSSEQEKSNENNTEKDKSPGHEELKESTLKPEAQQEENVKPDSNTMDLEEHGKVDEQACDQGTGSESKSSAENVSEPKVKQNEGSQVQNIAEAELPSKPASQIPPDENPERKSSPLKWIKETCPLTTDKLNDLFVTMTDFCFALKNVQPSSKREGFATVPDTTWDDIGALQTIRDELQVSILGPVKHADAFRKLGLTAPAGVLLCGPPGCGKTLLAKAVANEAGINFISVKGPELLNMYVGESERAVRQCFLRARNSSPCVIFFDELDALCPRRSDVADSGSGGRIVNQLLTEMDGVEARQGVFVMAASNRPDIIDPAILRPGRLDKILFVNLPTANDRFEILKAITKNSANPVLADDVSLEEIANSPEAENYTGADLSALVREASIAAFRELVLHTQNDKAVDLKVSRRHFHTAFSKTKPSVGKEDRLKYKLMAEKYSTLR